MQTIIQEKKAEHGAVGYTDFTAIYVSEQLLEEEKDLVRIHELSHIWLQHHIRGQAFEKSRKTVDHMLLNLAMDYEIAKHIYDKKDDAIITREQSRLYGGVTHEDTHRYPECSYFEEFYKVLEKEQEQKKKSWDALYNQFQKNGNSEQEQEREQIIKQAQHQATQTKIATRQVHEQKKLEQMKIKPSLGSLIDATLGRFTIVRTPSYRRPPRREREDFFQKGVTSKRKTPRLAVYVDRSGSFDAMKTRQATEALEKILKKYRGSIRHDTIYFNDELHTHDPVVGGGGTNHQLVLEDIATTRADVSIIITDDDDGVTHVPETLPPIIVIPIGCANSVIAQKIKAKEVTL